MSREKFRSLGIAGRKLETADRSTLDQFESRFLARNPSFISRVKFEDAFFALKVEEITSRFIRTISFSRVSLHPVIYPPILFIPVASTVTFFRDSFFAKGRDRSPKGTSARTSERSTFDRIKYGWGGRGWKIARSTLQS